MRKARKRGRLPAPNRKPPTGNVGGLDKSIWLRRDKYILASLSRPCPWPPMAHDSKEVA